MNFESNFRKLARFETKYSFTNLTYATKATKANYLEEYECTYNVCPQRLEQTSSFAKEAKDTQHDQLSSDLAYCGRQTPLLFCVSLKTLPMAL